MSFKHSDIPDLARKGYRPRVVNGIVTTLVKPPDDYVPAKAKSVREELADVKAKSAAADAKAQEAVVKADAATAEIEKLKPVEPKVK